MSAKWGCARWGAHWGSAVSNLQSIALPFSPPSALITWDTSATGLVVYQVYLNGEFYDHTSSTQMQVVLPKEGRFYFDVVAVAPRAARKATNAACFFAGITGDAVKLTWAHGALWGLVSWGTTTWGDDSERYRIYWDAGTGGGTTIRLDETRELDYTTKCLEDGTYVFRVVAVDEAGNEAPGVETTVIHSRPPTPISDLLLTSFIGPTTFTATWTPSPSSSVVTYEIYSNGGSGEIDYSAAVASVAAPAAGHTWTDAAVAGDWQINVRAKSASFEDDNVSEFYSFELSGVAPIVLSSPKPATPYAMLATPGVGGIITLDATYNATSEDVAATAINFYYDSGTGTIDFATIFASVSLRAHAAGEPIVFDVTFTTTPLVDGTTYLFAAKSIAANGLESAASGEAAGLADATAPSDVYSLTSASAFVALPAPLPDATIPGTV